jgi:hypothetical protein
VGLEIMVGESSCLGCVGGCDVILGESVEGRHVVDELTARNYIQQLA